MRKKIRDRINKNRDDDKDLDFILKSLPNLPLEDPFKKQGRPQKKKLKYVQQFNLAEYTQQLIKDPGRINEYETEVPNKEFEAQKESQPEIEKKPRHIGQFSKTQTFKILGQNIKEIKF